VERGGDAADLLVLRRQQVGAADDEVNPLTMEKRPKVYSLMGHGQRSFVDASGLRPWRLISVRTWSASIPAASAALQSRAMTLGSAQGMITP